MNWFNVGLMCFGSCYTLAFGFELARVRTELRAWPTWVAVLLGLVTHTTWLYVRARDVGGLPLTSRTLSLVALGWILAVICLYLMWYYRRGTLGVFLLPFVVALTVIAGLTRVEEHRAWDSLPTFWGAVHGVFLLLGAVAVSMGFLAGLMYLVQARRLKHKALPGTGLKLPSLERLERWNRHAITTAFPLLTVGVGIGIWLTAEVRKQGVSFSWTDPKLIFGLATWLVFAVLLHARYDPQLRGRRVALLTIVAFGLMIFTIAGVNPLFGTSHDSVGVVP